MDSVFIHVEKDKNPPSAEISTNNPPATVKILFSSVENIKKCHQRKKSNTVVNNILQVG